MVYPYSGVLCNNKKKEETTDIYNKINLKNIMVIDTKYYMFIYINVSENAKLWKQEADPLLPESRAGSGGLPVKGHKG